MKKVLFIDRDGTIILEPPVTFQVDSLEKLEFVPYAISALARIRRETDFELVMVSNQDGLGTPAYPNEAFESVQKKMLKILEGEGVVFDDIHIDTHFEKDNSPNRKPGTGMLTRYMNGKYDLASSYVIGDRITDVKLAKNLGAKALLIKNYDDPSSFSGDIELITDNWNAIADFLRFPARKKTVKRKTKETEIEITVDLDGTGQSKISTGLHFFDHMLEQIARHGNIDLEINCKGDLQVDEHHTIEDTAIVLGEVFSLALGNKRGMERYGFCLPMDDCLAQVALDFGGRNWIEWNAEFKREKVGDMPTEMFFHFFKSFSDAAKCNLNIKAEGENEHHKIESVFKAFAKAVKMAVARDKSNAALPSTKGVL
ncbi:MAG: bifunctional histidinol-phosphatase/imidazoleglycerol-phosphate dehydratase HisB [Bacteroidota bacterium]